MSEKVPPKKMEDWIEYGKQLSLNPHTSPRAKGAWIKAQGLDFVTDKVERSNAVNLYKQVNGGVDLSECPHNRPSVILQWLRDREGGLFAGANSVIYALKNRFMPGLIKIGLTKGSLTRRLINLNEATGVPVKFEVIYWETVEAKKLKTVEAVIHNILDDYRVNDYREFFCITPELAIEAIVATCAFFREELNPDLSLESINSLQSEIFTTNFLYRLKKTSPPSEKNRVKRVNNTFNNTFKNLGIKSKQNKPIVAQGTIKAEKSGLIASKKLTPTKALELPSLDFTDVEWFRCYQNMKNKFDEIYELSQQNQFLENSGQSNFNLAIRNLASDIVGDLEQSVEDGWSSDYDNLMNNHAKEMADRVTGNLFSKSEWTYYYLRTVEMLKNIFELADLNKFCFNTDRSSDLNRGIVLIAKMHTGDLFSAEGYETQSSDFKKLMTSSRVATPLSEETINTQGCCTWSKELWKTFQN